ncbi:MAG: EamA family transporter [Bacteroidales bacterium]|nr:EamA family transporter [Bacteroidales bacterium]
MTWYHLIVTGSVLISALAQMMLKKSALVPHRSFLSEYLNIWVIGGYLIFFASMLIDIWAVSHGVQVKEVSTIESFSYLFVPLLGWLFFGEKVSPKKFGAIALILAGVLVFFS